MGETLDTYSKDKEDIVEFLNLRVNEHERYISELERKNENLIDEKIELEKGFGEEINRVSDEFRMEIDNLLIKYTNVKTELDNLLEFKSKKEETEHLVQSLKNQLEKKDKDYRDTVYGLEKRMLQDKNNIKKEMLQRVNEAVSAFRRVADTQMAEVKFNNQNNFIFILLDNETSYKRKYDNI